MCADTHSFALGILSLRTSQTAVHRFLGEVVLLGVSANAIHHAWVPRGLRNRNQSLKRSRIFFGKGLGYLKPPGAAVSARENAHELIG